MAEGRQKCLRSSTAEKRVVFSKTQNLSDPLHAAQVAHRATFDLQALLKIQPYKTAIECSSREPWQGVLHCSSLLHPQSELRSNCSKLRPEAEAQDNEKRKPRSISL